jgi:hypothetical protein
VGNLADTLETVVRGLLAGVGTPGPYALEVACPLGSVMVGNHVDACNKIGKNVFAKSNRVYFSSERRHYATFHPLNKISFSNKKSK